MRLIDADKLKDDFYNRKRTPDDMKYMRVPAEVVYQFIDNAPTVEPEKPQCNQIAWEQGYEAGLSQGKSERTQGDLISREALKNDLITFFPDECLEGITTKTLFNQILTDIDNAPTVSFAISPDYVTELQNLNRELIKQLEEAERPQGEWISDYRICKCSVCNFTTVIDTYNFCPNCGADMRKGGTE